MENQKQNLKDHVARVYFWQDNKMKRFNRRYQEDEFVDDESSDKDEWLLPSIDPDEKPDPNEVISFRTYDELIKTLSQQYVIRYPWLGYRPFTICVKLPRCYEDKEIDDIVALRPLHDVTRQDKDGLLEYLPLIEEIHRLSSTSTTNRHCIRLELAVKWDSVDYEMLTKTMKGRRLLVESIEGLSSQQHCIENQEKLFEEMDSCWERDNKAFPNLASILTSATSNSSASGNSCDEASPLLITDEDLTYSALKAIEEIQRRLEAFGIDRGIALIKGKRMIADLVSPLIMHAVLCVSKYFEKTGLSFANPFPTIPNTHVNLESVNNHDKRSLIQIGPRVPLAGCHTHGTIEHLLVIASEEGPMINLLPIQTTTSQSIQSMKEAILVNAMQQRAIQETLAHEIVRVWSFNKHEDTLEAKDNLLIRQALVKEIVQQEFASVSSYGMVSTGNRYCFIKLMPSLSTSTVDVDNTRKMRVVLSEEFLINPLASSVEEMLPSVKAIMSQLMAIVIESSHLRVSNRLVQALYKQYYHECSEPLPPLLIQSRAVKEEAETKLKSYATLSPMKRVRKEDI